MPRTLCARTLKGAALVRYATALLAVPQFVADKLEAAPGVRQPLVLFAKTNPDVRVMDGRFQVIAEAPAICAASSRR
jgi:polar amino acid transport system substrate-binding protein